MKVIKTGEKERKLPLFLDDMTMQKIYQKNPGTNKQVQQGHRM